ncbi:rhomboid family intramembrane serine protease [Aureivirga sp. CE67]|uniref:rhomboid family intramembrane serine protease n=1 Tax=Aureivirga sp. CE67 TaxID=1788983 RepID=UPI0018CA84C2|nr:rhomboid family intramembrane serine protease [Aureivirga sp. CE67]
MNLIVLLIIGINVLVSWKGFNDPYFRSKYLFYVGRIFEGERYRMFTSGFLHADWMHLIFNMYALYFFSGVVFNEFHLLNFLLIYFGSLFVGNFISLLFHKHEYNYTALGASGAVSGIMYASIMLAPLREIALFPIPIPMPSYVFGIAYLLYTIYGMKKQIGNIGHSAHLGGAATGFALTLMMKPSLFVDQKWLVLALAVPLILLFIFEKRFR